MTARMPALSSPTLPADAASEESSAPWPRRATVIAGVLVVLLFGVMAFQRRWVSDDGMIVVRVVQELLAGNGPNFNPFQRDEAVTSPLWTFLLAACAFVVGGDIAVVAFVLGLVLAVAGLALAIFGSLDLHRQRGATGLLLPVGALVPVAIGGFWDFATSGLETGLSIFWLGLLWWLMVSVTNESTRARLITVAIVAGIGPLVRPDFALTTAVFGIALLWIARPGWRSGLAYVAIAAVPPLGYEIFRMGYYGITLPMPALAKEAGSSLWGRGFVYLMDFVDTYLIWIPLLLIVAIVARLLRRSPIDRRSALLMGAPLLSGVLLGLYVVKVGGDYMHARMWVPALFALLLPVMMLPVGRGHRIESAGALLIAVWALVAGISLRPPYHGWQFSETGLVDERSFELVTYNGVSDLTTTDSRPKNTYGLTTPAGVNGSGDRLLVLGSGEDTRGPRWTIPLSPSVRDNSAFFNDNMGIAAIVMPLDGTVVDLHGLATPLGGHLLLDGRGRVGHEKFLTAAWVLGEYADPSAIATMRDNKDVTKAQALAARHALSCAAAKELMDSVDEPMSWNRFWKNLVGAPSRTELRIPVDPFVAERQFCGP